MKLRGTAGDFSESFALLPETAKQIEGVQMLRPKIGDVYEISVLEKFAYLQDIRHIEHYGILVRVFTTLYPSQPKRLAIATSGPSFRSFYQIDAALKVKPPLVKFIESRALHDVDKSPVRFRQGRYILEEGSLPRVVTKLSPEEAALPQFVGASHSFLLRHILLANNIDIAETDLLSPGAEIVPDDDTLFYLYFKNKREAIRAATQIKLKKEVGDFAIHIQRSENDWLLRLNGKLERPMHETVDLLEALAVSCGGVFDGFEQPTSSRLPGR